MTFRFLLTAKWGFCLWSYELHRQGG